MTKKLLFVFTCLYFVSFSTKISKAQSSYYAPLAAHPYVDFVASDLEEQPPFSCGTDHLHQQRLQHDEQYRKRIEIIEKAYQERMTASDLAAKSMTCPNGVITLPIVIHVVHGDDPPGSGNPTPIGTNENLSVADIQLGINYLNQAFAGIPVCPGDPAGEDIGIQFCLAQRDINNNPSNGITRHYAPNLTDLDQCTEDRLLKALSQTGGSPTINPWPATDYINVWLVDEVCSPCSSGCGMVGYTTMAASHGSATDGWVHEAGFWSNSCLQAKLGAHELGHYFDLYHTFQGGCTNNNCLTDGDLVCDTPPDNDNTPTASCTSTNSCTTDANSGFGADQNDLRDNFMDYGQLTCMTTFTSGQKARMLDAVCHTRNSLIESVGCLDPCPNPIVAGFAYSPASPVAVGSLVNLTNTSTGSGTNYQWYVGNTPISTNLNTSHTFSNSGTYDVSLVVSNNDPLCMSDSIALPIEVFCPLNAEFMPDKNEINAGSTIDFTNTTVGATSYEWFVEGISQGTTMDLLGQVFPSVGSYSVYLVACDAVCCDTSEVSLISVGNCSSGKQGAIWYFGNRAGLDFNTNPPTPLTNSQINTLEGCASMSDNNGSLLFYTDGLRVWDRTHTVMPNGNGLFGSPSSAQSAIIVPKPGNTNNYFIFTVDILTGGRGFRYSEVDLTLNGGLGDVVAGVKNILLFNNSTEKVTAIQHCNGVDYWVLGHPYHSNTFHAYLIDNTGVNTTPVSTNVGTVHTGGNAHNTIGYLKASPSGNKVALATWQNLFEVLDFDKATGVLSNPITLTSGNYSLAYGVEFSPDETKLYGSTLTSRLFQFDLTAGSAAAINASVVTLQVGGNQIGALQLALDGKLYAALRNNANLGIVNFPNNLGVSCNYVHNSVPVGGTCLLGLPTIFPSFFVDQKPYISGEILACVGDEFTYTTPKGGVCDAANYQFIHSGNATITAQVDTSITLQFGQAGTDTLFMIKESVCQNYYDTLIIQTNTAPTFQWMDSDTLLCPGQGGIISFSTPADSVVLTNTTSGFSQNLMNNIHGFLPPAVDSCYVLQLIDTQTTCDTLINFCIIVSEPCCPSSVGDFSNTEYRCASDSPTPPNVPILADVIATLDVNADDKTLIWMPDVDDPIVYTGNNCDPQTFEYELIVGCTNDPTLALSAGTITVVVYPDVSVTNNVIVDDGTCGPTIDVECNNYVVTNDIDGNGATPNYVGLGLGQVTFTVTNPVAQANGVSAACVSENYIGNYLCCPTVVGDFSNSEVHCDSDAPLLPAIPTDADILATVDVPSQATINWSPDPTVPIFHSGNHCFPQTFVYQLTIGCLSDPNVALDGGAITVTLYPEISASNNIIHNDSSCGPRIHVECPNYLISNSLDGNGATPDYSNLDGINTVTFTLLNPAAQAAGVATDCVTGDYVATYDCCRAEAGVLDAPNDLCPGDPIVATTNDVTGNSTHQTLPIYTLSYLLIDANTNVIVDIQTSPTGNVATFNPVPSDYIVCSYSELTSNPPIPSPLTTALGTLHQATIGSQHDGCFDQSCRTICVPEPLVVTCNQNMNPGSGGMSPFYFNTHEICIEGGKQAYNYVWNTTGFVRHGQIGNGHLRILHADNAYWAVTVTDAHGCGIDVNGDPLIFSSAGNPFILSIYDYTVSPATFNNGCQNGGISVYAQGGDGNYMFSWSGPATWTAPAPATGNGSTGGGTNNVYHLSGLPSGWYSVTVTDGAGETTSGWYWLPCAVPGRGKQSTVSENVHVYPNPFSEQIKIAYTLDKQSDVQLNVFDMSGRKVGHLLHHKQQEAGKHQQIWNAEQLPAGIYYYRLQIDEAVYSDKIVKF